MLSVRLRNRDDRSVASSIPDVVRDFAAAPKSRYSTTEIIATSTRPFHQRPIRPLASAVASTLVPSVVAMKHSPLAPGTNVLSRSRKISDGGGDTVSCSRTRTQYMHVMRVS